MLASVLGGVGGGRLTVVQGGPCLGGDSDSSRAGGGAFGGNRVCGIFFTGRAVSAGTVPEAAMPVVGVGGSVGGSPVHGRGGCLGVYFGVLGSGGSVVGRWIGCVVGVVAVGVQYLGCCG